MAGASESNKMIARTATSAFGVERTITRYWDDDHRRSVDLLEAADAPQSGVTSYSTIGLSDWPLIDDGVEYPARLEIVGACGTKFKKFDNAIATAAFNIINSKWFCYPGAIFPDVLAMYEASPTMRHFFFVPPFIWEDDLLTLRLPDKIVAWLLALPISEREFSYTIEHGTDALEGLFVEKQVDIFDLRRPSVV